MAVDDFNKSISLAELKHAPPKISVSVTISKGSKPEPDDLATVGNWLTKLDASYEAMLTYEFFLPEKETQDYMSALSGVNDLDPSCMDKAWKIINHDFIRLYTYKIWGGNPANQSAADSESLQKFDFQFLDAIRDVERDMLTGKNAMLRDVFNFFIDYEIKSVPEATKSKAEKASEIKAKKIQFSDQADTLIDLLQTRMEKGKDQILSYAHETGASSFNNARPDFEGSISDIEMFSALKLIVQYQTGIKIPATHNGLGYNNLIYMSLLLAKMQVNSDGNYMGSNSKVFASLAIEEPEAHLHPAMQYKFLKFLEQNKVKKKVRQIFVTTHSTHITSAVSLDELICLHTESGITKVGYPGKVFPADGKSKKYVQRFLDATKCDMLFAQKVILVEGLAEQLLMSILAEYEGKSLEDNHVTVINVGGNYFDHFLHLFDSTKPHTIHKKVVCLTDRDPSRSLLPDGKYKKCFPFEANSGNTLYQYQDSASSKISGYASHPNISIYSQDKGLGKTFEYELVTANPLLELLVTESMQNQQQIKNLMKLSLDTSAIEDYLALLPEGSATNPNTSNLEIKAGIRQCNWTEEKDKKRAVIAARYLNSIGKGENALELSYNLKENLQKKGTSEYKEFQVPAYIKQAIAEVCQ